MSKPLFIIKNRFQKRTTTYRELLSDDVLNDVCMRVTGQCDFKVKFDENGYNKGRLVELRHNGKRDFITFSEADAGKSRNSSFQSVTSALNTWAIESRGKGHLFFYFLRSSGNYQSRYFSFMYRLLRTAGIEFLNDNKFLGQPVVPFNSVEDLSRARDENRSRNRGNRSSYITVGENGSVEVYAKTYGANKYESTLFGMALARLSNGDINIYQIAEHGLDQLPDRSLEALRIVGRNRIHVFSSDIQLDTKNFNETNHFRSPRFMFNLFEKFGPKRCVLCGCNLPEIVQGAHVWGISQIKKTPNLSLEKKLEAALDGENGLWLCENHHRMFDSNVIAFLESGQVVMRKGLFPPQQDFVKWATPTICLPEGILTQKFKSYLAKRYPPLTLPLVTLLPTTTQERPSNQ